MNNNITKYLYSFIDEIDNSTLSKKIDNYKNIIKTDKEILKLIEDFNYKKNYDKKDLQQSKIKLYSNEIVNNYLKCEQELNYIIMDLNKDLNKLIDKKGCIR